MPRLQTFLLLALLLSPLSLRSSPAPEPKSLAPLEPAARAAAEADIDNLCRSVPEKCDEGQRLLSDYFKTLNAATICDEGSCEIKMVRLLNHRLRDLDERENRLPRPAGETAARPLLRLSVMASGRLMRAAVRMNSPESAIQYSPDDRRFAARDVEEYCLMAASDCTAARALLASDDQLRDELEICGVNGCAFEKADELLLRAEAEMSGYLGLPKIDSSNAVGLYSLANGTDQRIVSLYTTIVNRELDALREGANGLEKSLDHVEKDPADPADSIKSMGADLHERHRRAALGADRLAHHLGYGGDSSRSSHWRGRVNAEAARLSALRARALAVLSARGLVARREAENGVLAGAPRPPPSAAPASRPEPSRTLFDSRMIPRPEASVTSVPDILPGEPSRLKLVNNMLSENPLARADALRRLGLSKTIGDPGRYAAHAFTQKDPSGCAVAAQAQILLAHGLVADSVTAETLERVLIIEAKRKNLMITGTPPEYSGSLLVERGMLVAKNRRTDHATLEAALRRGSVLMAGVNARALWGLGSGPALPHAILLTGAEITSSGTEVLGVYINDSGVSPPGAGRFVPWAEFLRAWQGDFVEVL